MRATLAQIFEASKNGCLGSGRHGLLFENIWNRTPSIDRASAGLDRYVWCGRHAVNSLDDSSFLFGLL
jgi:hypothetical protein